MSWPLLVLLAFLATFRITWLLNRDLIASRIRRAARRLDARRRGSPIDDDEIPPLQYFVECPWCVSVWVGVPISIATILWPTNRVWLIALLALSASAVTGIVAVLVGRVVDE